MPVDRSLHRLLQEEFAAIISDPQELANLWHEIDFNDSGDVGYGEWLHFVESKFSIIAHGKPTRLAFVQQDAEDGDMDQVSRLLVWDWKLHCSYLTNLCAW